MIYFEPDAVGILEQHRIISRRPRAVLRRMHDRRADRFQKAVNLIDVATLAVTHRYLASQIGPDAGYRALSVQVLADGRLALLGEQSGVAIDPSVDGSNSFAI